MESGGDVFADLGLWEPEELFAKAMLVLRICELIAQREPTQVWAGSLLGIDQPKVSALMRGRTDGFSTDLLFRFLNVLGHDVRASPHVLVDGQDLAETGRNPEKGIDLRRQYDET